MRDYFPVVVQVEPLENYRVKVFFDDGKIIAYDMSKAIDGEVFLPLQDPKTFKEACTVLNGTLAWDLIGNRDPEKCIDIDPFTLYSCPAIHQETA